MAGVDPDAPRSQSMPGCPHRRSPDSDPNSLMRMLNRVLIFPRRVDGATMTTKRVFLLGVLFLVGWGANPPGASSQPGPPDQSSPAPLDTPEQRNSAPAGLDTTHLGVVWAPPQQPGVALRQLDNIHAAGATAVRLTKIPASDTLFARADTLGLDLYLDLPVAYTRASRLQNALENARSDVERVQTLATEHPSVAFVGLAQGPETTTPSACAVLQNWSNRVRRGTRLHTYYVTPFTSDADRCTKTVDVTLLDTRGTTRPVLRWHEWNASTDEPIGFAALGTWVSPAASSGLNVPHSLESQARYLERSLSTVLDTLHASVPTFVYRWRDQGSPLLSSRRYGLHDHSGTPRPAADVLSGVYTGTQRVFAFPSGTAPTREPHGFILFGWALVAIIAILYAQTPFVRATLYRYFIAHGFYQSAIREGRDVNSIVNVILLLVVGGTVGLIVAVLARSAGDYPSTIVFLEALPTATQFPLAYTLEHPVQAGGVAAGVTLLLLGAWTFILTLVTIPFSSFTLRQALMLVVWPCWPVLPGMILALAVDTASPLSSKLLGVLLLGGGLLTLVTVTLRVLLDFFAVNNGPLIWLPIVLVPSPLTLAAALVYGVVSYNLPVPLLWHLVMST